MNQHDDTRILLKDALALHPDLRHMHWTKERKDGGGNVIGVEHHHFVWEFGLETGVHCTGRDARDRLAEALVGYYPHLHGAWVSFAASRNFNVQTTISDEERARREAEEKKQDERSKKKRGRKPSKSSDDEAQAA